MNRSFTRILIIALAICAVVYIVFIWSGSKDDGRGLITRIMKPAAPDISPTPTPFPFEDMTVPYLRARNYESTLGAREQVYTGNGYTAYLTNYISDGLKINALLTIPAGERPATGWPAIIFVHGYIAPTIYTTQGYYEDHVDYLAQNGFVILKTDLRGHGDSQGEPGGAYYSSDYIIDVLNARAALQKADFVNKDKIGLWGHSMGGNVVMRATAAAPDIPATVIWAGAVYTYEDMRAYGIQDNSYRPPATQAARTRRRQILFNTYGEFSPESDFWRQVAPTNYLNDLKGAVQLNHAVNDDVVNIGYSRGLNTLLEKTFVPHELHEYESGGHNINGAAFSAAMQNTVDFYRKYLDN